MYGCDFRGCEAVCAGKASPGPYSDRNPLKFYCAAHWQSLYGGSQPRRRSPRLASPPAKPKEN